jgi:hypothetical protein
MKKFNENINIVGNLKLGSIENVEELINTTSSIPYYTTAGLASTSFVENLVNNIPAYTEGNGINISGSNSISLDISSYTTDGTINLFSPYGSNIYLGDPEYYRFLSISGGGVTLAANSLIHLFGYDGAQIALSANTITSQSYSGYTHTDLGTNGGIKYGADYSADYNNRSLVDKEFVETQISNITFPVTSVNTQTGAVVLTTSNVSEGSNFYYTTSKFNSSLATKTTDNLSEGSTNKYYSSTLFNTDFSSKSTDNLTQGSTNKYYSTTLFNTDLASKTTDNLTQGSSNFYFSNARSIASTLTGFANSSGAVSSVDTILIALEKLQGNIVASLAHYNTIRECAGAVTANASTGNYYLSLQANQQVVASGVSSTVQPATIYINSADYPTIAGLTPKLRITVRLMTNATAPSGTFTFGLYPITNTGGAGGTKNTTLGTVVSGSTGASQATPTLSTNYHLESSDFSIPANGHYVIGLAYSGTTLASSYTQMNADLQYRYV